MFVLQKNVLHFWNIYEKLSLHMEKMFTNRCNRDTCFKQSDFDTRLYKNGLSRENNTAFLVYKPVIKVVYNCIRSML